MERGGKREKKGERKIWLKEREAVGKDSGLMLYGHAAMIDMFDFIGYRWSPKYLSFI